MSGLLPSLPLYLNKRIERLDIFHNAILNHLVLYLKKRIESIFAGGKGGMTAKAQYLKKRIESTSISRLGCTRHITTYLKKGLKHNHVVQRSVVHQHLVRISKRGLKEVEKGWRIPAALAAAYVAEYISSPRPRRICEE